MEERRHIFLFFHGCLLISSFVKTVVIPYELKYHLNNIYMYRSTKYSKRRDCFKTLIVYISIQLLGWKFMVFGVIIFIFCIFAYCVLISYVYFNKEISSSLKLLVLLLTKVDCFFAFVEGVHIHYSVCAFP